MAMSDLTVSLGMYKDMAKAVKWASNVETLIVESIVQQVDQNLMKEYEDDEKKQLMLRLLSDSKKQKPDSKKQKPDSKKQKPDSKKQNLILGVSEALKNGPGEISDCGGLWTVDGDASLLKVCDVGAKQQADGKWILDTGKLRDKVIGEPDTSRSRKLDALKKVLADKSAPESLRKAVESSITLETFYQVLAFLATDVNCLRKWLIRHIVEQHHSTLGVMAKFLSQSEDVPPKPGLIDMPLKEVTRFVDIRNRVAKQASASGQNTESNRFGDMDEEFFNNTYYHIVKKLVPIAYPELDGDQTRDEIQKLRTWDGNKDTIDELIEAYKSRPKLVERVANLEEREAYLEQSVADLEQRAKTLGIVKDAYEQTKILVYYPRDKTPQEQINSIKEILRFPQQ